MKKITIEEYYMKVEDIVYLARKIANEDWHYIKTSYKEIPVVFA